RLEIDDQPELARLHDRQVGGLLALEDAPGIDADLMERVHNVASVAHQSADFGKFTQRKCRGKRMAHCQRGEMHPSASKKGVVDDEDGVGSFARKSCEGNIDLAAGA